MWATMRVVLFELGYDGINIRRAVVLQGIKYHYSLSSRVRKADSLTLIFSTLRECAFS